MINLKRVIMLGVYEWKGDILMKNLTPNQNNVVVWPR